MPKRAADVALILGLAVLYATSARLGLALHAAVAGFATLVWPPTGISIAAMLIFGTRVWPGIFFGAVITNVMIGAPLVVTLGISTGNTLEAVTAAYLLRRDPGFNVTLESVRAVVALIILGALFSTLISSSVGVTSLYLGGVISEAHLRMAWRAWWVGDMAGALLVAPIILVWSTPPRARFDLHWIEKVALSVAVVGISMLGFFGRLLHVPALAPPFHYADMLLAVLIWAALRFGQRGTVTAATIVAATAVAGTALGYGPFALPDLTQSFFSMQTFMALVAATFLLLGATISERRIVEEDVREAREAATRANLAKSEFLAVMSHELRTPLNAIAGYADLLGAGLYGPLNDKQVDAVTRIHKSEKDLLSVIEEVVGFVRAEKGEVTVQSERVAVAAAFDAVQPLVEPEFRRKHFVVKRELSLPRLAVHADPKSLQQILVSLLSNASKYTHDGGMITFGANKEGARVRIWVTDTGVGIPQEEIKRVFEPFFQAERGPTRRYSGMGLGLTIARDLARRMKGEVTIASKVASGTTASIVLPAA
jgi:signal transduction histidine kinase